jgi:phosphoribosylglycinamide formyltransferase 1
MKKYRIAIFASGSGTNAEQIIRYFENHRSIEVALLVSNNANAYALERAKQFNIPACVFSRSEFTQGETVLRLLAKHDVTHIVLAGFLWLIPDYLITQYPERIINIHPALLPLFGGKGMYGMKVHEAVLAAGRKETGITIHIVNEHYDEGRVLFQTKFDLEEGCDARAIADKVHALEYEHYPKVIEQWITGER